MIETGEIPVIVDNTVATGATHQSLIDDEQDARTVTQAIRKVVASVRTSQPLR